MPRDQNGNYTFPAGSGNPVTGGSTILADGWANPTLADLRNEMTNSLDRQGRGGMLAPFRFADGTQALPGISWVSETSTGIRRAAANDMRFVVAASDKFRVNGVGPQIPEAGGWAGIASGTYFRNAANHAELWGGSSPARKMLTNDNGITVEGFIYDQTDQRNIDIRHRLRNSVGGFRTQLDATAGSVTFDQTDAAGTRERTWAFFNRFGDFAFYRNGDRMIASESSTNIRIGAAGTTATLVLVGDPTDNTSGIDIRLDSANGQAGFEIDSATGNAALNQRSAAGVLERQWMTLLRNGDITLRDGSNNLRFTLSSTGGKLDATWTHPAAPAADEDITNKLFVDTQVATKANVVHTHAIADVTGLQAALDAKANQTDLDALTTRVAALEARWSGNSLTVGGTLTVAGAASLQSTLAVTGATLLTGGVNGSVVATGNLQGQRVVTTSASPSTFAGPIEISDYLTADNITVSATSPDGVIAGRIVRQTGS